MSANLDDDGLATPVVGSWAKRKYHFLTRYLEMFSKGMRYKFPQRHFIDLFAGAGRARIRDSAEIVQTSALIAATTEVPFTHIHCCEKKGENCKALQARLSKHRNVDTFQITEGDANQHIDTIMSRVPTNALCVTFADPFGLHLNFATVASVARRKSDLIILLADNMDAVRNWDTYYLDKENSNLDLFIGERGWREKFLSVNNDKVAREFREHYQQRLETLGYLHFGTCRVQNANDRDIYTLLFASRNPRGLDFWNKTLKKDEKGQSGLF